MDFVAHVQRLRDQRFELDAAGFREDCVEHAVQRGCDPSQAIDDVGTIGAEAQHLAEPFIQVAEGAVAGRAIADNPHRHRRADDAGHRADRAMMVAGRESNVAALHEALGGLAVLSPALKQERADDSALHGAAHALPLDRRSGVKNTMPASCG